MGFVTYHKFGWKWHRTKIFCNLRYILYFNFFFFLLLLLLLQNEWDCREPDWFASGWWFARPDEGVQHSTCCRAWSRFNAFTVTVCQGKMYHEHCLIRQSCVTAAYFGEEILSFQFSSVQFIQFHQIHYKSTRPSGYRISRSKIFQTLMHIDSVHKVTIVTWYDWSIHFHSCVVTTVTCLQALWLSVHVWHHVVLCNVTK